MVYEQFNFTNEFQDALLACLIRHPEEFFAFGEVIKPAYFNGPAAAELVFRLLEYKKKYGSYPNFDTLGNFAFHKAAKVSVDHGKETLDYVEKLSRIDTSDKVAILDLSMDFVKERAVYDGLKRIHAAWTEGKACDVNPVQLMEEAVAVGNNMMDMGLSLCHDSNKILDDVFNRSYGIRTGYAAFDNMWKFGWAPGWLIVPLAPPKRFKTAFAINLAINIAATQDVDVLYYACEIQQELAALRAITNITGWTQEQLSENLERGKIVAKRQIHRKLLGNIFFKGFPAKSTAISEIKAHAKTIIKQRQLLPRAIVIDYAETVRPDSVDKKAPDWRQQSDIYTQARALGAELGCCVIMPDRCNAETVGKSVPSMKSFQGSFEKAGIVDIAIGLCATDDEIKHSRMRYFVFLNRHGDGMKHFDGKLDAERMQLTVDGELDYNPDEDDDSDKVSKTHYRKKKAVKGGRMQAQMARDAEMTQSD